MSALCQKEKSPTIYSITSSGARKGRFSANKNAIGELETGAQMTELRFALAILLPLLISTAHADPPAVARAFRAEFYLPGCKDFIAGRTNFDSGRCVGAVEVLDALNLDTKLFCVPEATNNLARVRIIVAFIEARPERAKEDFRLLANEAMAKAWPCKK
jgi:hypothetical protein